MLFGDIRPLLMIDILINQTWQRGNFVSRGLRVEVGSIAQTRPPNLVNFRNLQQRLTTTGFPTRGEPLPE